MNCITRIGRTCLCSAAVLLFVLFSSSGLYAQKTLKIDVKDVSLEQVLELVRKQTDYKFSYTEALDADKIKVSVNVSGQPAEEFFKSFFPKYGIEYKIVGTLVALTPAKKSDAAVSSASGVVKDSQGYPLSGVVVSVKDKKNYTITGSNGSYNLDNVEKGDILVFNMVGFKTLESDLIGANANITLEEDVQMLEDVVVTGYQTISKERATGAYSIVDAKVLEQKPTANLSEALNGLVPGLAVQSSSVDGDIRFIIRGKGTLQKDQVDSDPLIVVDGFPISGYSNDNDPFSTINPNDVESVTVLKDAAATSIYGARAANGVIVITTKKGRAGDKLDISVGTYYSISSRPDLEYAFNMASAENQFRVEELRQHYSPINLAYNDPYDMPSARKTYFSAVYSLLYERDSRGNITADEYNARKQELIDIANSGQWKDDLQKYIFRRMMHQQYNVALRGATEKLNYAFSASFDDEKSYLQGNGNQRVLLNLSSSAKLTKNLTFDLSINTSFEKDQNNGTSISSISSWLSPWTRLVDDDGNFTHIVTESTVYQPILDSEYAGKTPADWYYNPVEDRQYTDNRSNTMNYRIQGGFNYSTSWGLNLSAKGQYEYRNYSNRVSYDQKSYFVRDLYNTYSTLNPDTGTYVSYFPSGGVFTDAGHKYESYNVRGQADYKKDFGAHSLSVLLGSEIISATTEITPTITRYGFNKYTNSVLTTPDYVTYQYNIFGVWSRMPFEQLGTLSTMEDRFFSVYSNIAYTYKDKYSLTANFRTDASNFQSKSQRDKFSPFYSIGASWLISKEKFMSNADWVNQLKLRASYGIAGVAAGKSGTSSVTTIATYPGDIVYSNNQPFNTIAARGNSTLTWEKSRTINIGLDAAFFDNKLNGSIELYDKYSYDVLSAATVPTISYGTTRATFNNAAVSNRGVELSLSANIPVARDLYWSGTLNYAYNRNRVVEYYLNTSFPAFNTGYVESYPVDLITMLIPVGYTPEGFIILQGKDGTQEIIDSYEKSHCTDQILRNQGETIDDNNWVYYLGTRTPTGNLSFSSSFTWKGLTLSFMLTGKFGYYVSRNDLASIDSNQSHYSKQLNKSFEVYDEGYANQNSYTAFPLYNDENYPVFSGWTYRYSYNSSMNFRNRYIKGDHIRMSEVYLGYELPKRLLSRQGVFSRVNVYARANNLGLIWSANGEMDPDYTFGTLKPMPTFMFGLKLGF